MDLADSEAASLGNIALTCMRRGAIPPVSLRPLWFTNRGKCIGLRIIGHDEDEFDMWGNHTGADYLDPLFPIVSHLKAYAGEVLETEGIEWLLYEWEHTRDIYHEMYPVENTEWGDIEEAMSASGRGKSTIYSWASKGWLRKNVADGHATLYCLDDAISLREGIPQGRPKETLESAV